MYEYLIQARDANILHQPLYWPPKKQITIVSSSVHSDAHAIVLLVSVLYNSTMHNKCLMLDLILPEMQIIVAEQHEPGSVWGTQLIVTCSNLLPTLIITSILCQYSSPKVWLLSNIQQTLVHQPS